MKAIAKFNSGRLSEVSLEEEPKEICLLLANMIGDKAEVVVKEEPAQHEEPIEELSNGERRWKMSKVKPPPG